jgi:hypothetical protein
VIKVRFVIVVFLFILAFGFISQAQEQINSEKLLTEIAVDVKYIKQSIQEIKSTNLKLAENLKELENRVTRVEEKTFVLDEKLCAVGERDLWLLGLVGSFLIVTLGLQYKRSVTFRHNDESNSR